MIATKEQEHKALEKIKEIVEALGKDSYIAAAFEGCFEIAEENINNDFACSMKHQLETARLEAEKAKQSADTFSKKNELLQKQITYLSEKIEQELEWKPYENKESVGQTDYEHLAKDRTTRFLSDEEAKDILYNWLGFAKERVEIIKNVNTYEINRHNQLRPVGMVDRRPVYNATDWNYIRFKCGGVDYEFYNDQIRLVS